MPDSSGIYSLGGFAYQIKAFLTYLLSLEENMEAGFETLDDVTVKNITPLKIDENEDIFRNMIVAPDGIKAIQVKRTSINDAISKQIILNWMLLEGAGESITDYILFTDDAYNNKDIVFDITAEDLFDEVLSSQKTLKSSIGKVKKKYKKDKDKFIEIYNTIKSKYSFVSAKNIDQLIYDNCKIIFKKAGVNRVTFHNRIEELLRHITYEIMESVNNKKSFRISYEEMIALSEEICNRFTDNYICPAFSEFKKINKIDFESLEIAKSREYSQLLACKLPPNLIQSHLQYCSYYRNICYGYKELNKIAKIRDIEETTYDNFENVKFALQTSGEDSPYQRLNETKKQPNSHAESDQIRYGSSIHLTRDEEIDHQISWEDADNEES